MKSRLLTVLLTSTTLVLVAGLSSGCRPRHRDPAKVAAWVEKRVVSHTEDVLEDIDATEAQSETIVAAARRVAQQVVVLQGVREETKQLLLSEWQAEQPDNDRMHRMIDRRIDDLRRVLHIAADAFTEAHQTLTPEQRAAVLEEL